MIEPPTGEFRPQSALSRAKQVFLAVRKSPEDERGAHLDRLCGDDAELRAMVVTLLESDRAPMPFEFLAHEIVAARRNLAGDAALPDADEPDDPHLGTLIGPYRVIRKIGEGGFGVVYEAEQESPVRRTVALKVLKLGMDTRQFVARFEAERQALAIMDHPGIARVFDAGATTSGRPYFAMEMVHGTPITAYGDAHGLSIRNRLSLFSMVCDAVHHAHQKGVIHRDLKPGNILIAEVDGRPSPKIIDFGIAKATSVRLTDKSIVTEFRQMIGTPEYMSPEQAEHGHGAGDVDTRSDVYSLGVVLYELLAGMPPFDPDRLRSAPYAEMQRIIREVDPPRPSTRAHGLSTVASVAAGRATESARLASLLRGELDWIVMKCLEKDRSRRYGTVAELGADVQRYLANMPVSARPAGSAYVVRKFVRRHRTVVAVATGFAILVLAGMAGTTVGLVSAVNANRKLDAALKDVRTQRDLARANEMRAQTQLLQSEQLSNFLGSMLASVNPTVTRGRDTTVMRELLNDARARIDRGELDGAPVVEATMRMSIAKTYKAIGDNAAAVEVIEPAIKLADLATAKQQVEYLNVRIAAAQVYLEWRRDDLAQVQLDRVLQVRGAASMPDDDQAADCYASYSLVHSRRQEYDQALAMHERVLAIRIATHGEKSIAAASAVGNMAGLLTDMGRQEDALVRYEQALVRYREITPLPVTHLAILQNNRATLLVELNRFADAEAAARDSLEKCAVVFKPNHQSTGMSWHTLGTALSRQKRHDEAFAAFDRATAIFIGAFDESHLLVAQCRLSLARELMVLHRYAEAEDTLLAAHASLEAKGPGGEPSLREAVQLLVEMYGQWDALAPGEGHAERASDWKQR